MITLYRGLLSGPVHAFDLAIGPGVGWLGEAVFDAVSVAHAVEKVAPSIDLMRHVSELCSIVRQHLVHFVRERRQHPAQKIGRQYLRGLRVQLGEGHFAGAVDGDE